MFLRVVFTSSFFPELTKPKKPVEVMPVPAKDDELAADDDDDEGEESDEDGDEEMAADEPQADDDAPEDEGGEDESDDDDDYDDDKCVNQFFFVINNFLNFIYSDSSTTGRPKPTQAASTQSSVESRPPTSTKPPSTPDPYFTHFDPRIEHQAYKEAQQRLEEMHREKVTKVMKDWSDLEERYQDMRQSDPAAAEQFKQRMTQRFQRTVQSLEEEGNAEKHQLIAMHQQRVMAHINQRKKDAMSCYAASLDDNPPNVWVVLESLKGLFLIFNLFLQTHRVQKCLQKLLRSLHKDRHHTIAHYKHLLSSSFEQAEREKGLTLEHLTDIDRLVNRSLQMLER